MKIIFGIFIATFVTAMAVSWIPLQSMHVQLRRDLETAFPLVLNHVSARVENWLSNGKREVEHAATSDRVALIPHGDGEQMAREAELLRRLRISSQLEGFVILDAAGNAQLEIGALPLLSQEMYAELFERHENRLFYLRHTKELAIVAAAPIQAASGEVLGYLFGFYNAATLGDLLSSDSLKSSGEIYLATEQAKILTRVRAHPADGRWSIGNEITTTYASDTKIRSYPNYAGRYVLGSSRRLHGLDVVLAVEQEYEETFQTVFSISRWVIAIDMLMVLIFSLLGYRVTKTIMQPIYALSDAAQRITRGNLDVHLPEPKSQDELFLLTRAFNEMTKKLRESREEIEEINARLQDQNVELHYANNLLERISITDGLTQLYNHRFFQDHLAQETRRVDRSGDPLSMLMLDIDDFKKLNDNLGHSAGDQILMEISSLLRRTVRESDLVARYGGEEFVITTSGTDLEGAQRLAEKIRSIVDRHEFKAGSPPQAVHVTISIGVAEYKGDRKNFFERADRALYRAKERGKNCVVTDVETYS